MSNINNNQEVGINSISVDVNQPFMIIGTDTTNNVRALVGIGENLTKAKDIVGSDYLQMLKDSNTNPVSNPVCGPDSQANGVFYYWCGTYSWHVTPISFNTVLNLGL